MSDSQLADWRQHALKLESEINQVVVGQESPVRLITTAIFARGHVLLKAMSALVRPHCCAHLPVVLAAATSVLKALLT